MIDFVLTTAAWLHGLTPCSAIKLLAPGAAHQRHKPEGPVILCRVRAVIQSITKLFKWIDAIEGCDEGAGRPYARSALALHPLHGTLQKLRGALKT